MYRKYLLLCFTIVLSGPASAAQWEPISFNELIKKAEAVVLGAISSYETYVLEEGTRGQRSNLLPNTYTVMNLDVASVVTGGGLMSVPEGVTLYLDGGIVETPDSLAAIYPDKKYYGTLNTSVPLFDPNSRQEYIFFICDNGKNASPFCNDSAGVFIVDFNGNVRDVNGSPVVGIDANDNIVTTTQNTIFQPKINTEPPRPAHLQINNLSSIGENPIRMIDFVDRISSNVGLQARDLNITLRPTRLSNLFSN